MGRRALTKKTTSCGASMASCRTLTGVSKLFRSIVEAAGLRRIRLHDLRHTFATLLRQDGIPIEVISRILGHASISITLNVYDHLQGSPGSQLKPWDRILECASNNQSEEASVRSTLEGAERNESEPCRDRTCDQLIKSQLLYQLS